MTVRGRRCLRSAEKNCRRTRFICGAVIRLMVLGSNKPRGRVIFVGVKPDHYLVVETSRLNGAAVKHEGAGLVG